MTELNTTKLPQALGPIHFIGIGGIGMSGIAEVLLNHGYTVQGSDLNSTAITQRLQELGATVYEGHDRAHVHNAEVIVISSAIQSKNPELFEARKQGVPIVRRAEMLAELMRLKSNIAIAGTHGKTTTTTVVATLLDRGGLDPTVINGGVIHAYGSNARLGAGEWMVVEADESDGTFIRLPATIAVVTNIDPEHLDYYGNFDNLKKAFDSFITNIPFYGCAVCCIDHPEVQSLVGRINDRRVITYGLNAQADVCAKNVSYVDGVTCFDVLLRHEDKTINNCRLPMPGDYNVANALAAIAVARSLDIPRSIIWNALSEFSGVNRRFTNIGTVNGVEIIDDYAHHPVEIASVLKAARQATRGRLIAIHQPHRYSRLVSLFDEFCTCFNDADVVAIADVYAAGEKPIAGADRDSLVTALNRHGHRQITGISGPDELAAFVQREAKPGDMVISLGAGSISAWANNLPNLLKELGQPSVN